jgi:hypothetical protein
MLTAMRADKSIERRLRALEKQFPPGKWDLRAVPFEDLLALEGAFDPSNNLVEKPSKVSKRLLRLIRKLEADTE